MSENERDKAGQLDNIIDESQYYRTFFGKSAAYYEKIYKRMLEGRSFIFNPYAFFFSIFWMAYRKMYVELIVFILAIALLNNFALFIMGVYTYKATTATAVLFAGLYANVFYMKKAQRTVKRATESYINTEQRLDFLEQEGGVSYIGPVVVACVLGIILFGITAFFNYLDTYNY